MLKALKKFLGKDQEVAQPTPSPAPQATPSVAPAAPSSPAPLAPEPQAERAPRKPRNSGESRSQEPRVQAEKQEPRAQAERAAKPRRERSQRKPKPVDTWKLEDFVVEPQEGKTRFHDFKLDPRLMHGIHDLGFPYCTPIQAQVLGFTLKGKDAIGLAQTGTGKTAAFLISTITQLLTTPGRLLDFNQRGEVHLDMVEVMVLDEADRMLDMGFIPQVRQIIRQTPPKSERQTLLFSATFTDDVMNLARQWTTDPAIVEIEPENVASDTVEQHVYAVSSSDKYKLLYNLVAQNNWERVMVFANRRDEVRRIEERLTKDGISASRLWKASAPARSACWWPPTWPVAAFTSTASAT